MRWSVKGTRWGSTGPQRVPAMLHLTSHTPPVSTGLRRTFGQAYTSRLLQALLPRLHRQDA